MLLPRFTGHQGPESKMKCPFFLPSRERYHFICMQPLSPPYLSLFSRRLQLLSVPSSDSRWLVSSVTPAEDEVAFVLTPTARASSYIGRDIKCEICLQLKECILVMVGSHLSSLFSLMTLLARSALATASWVVDSNLRRMLASSDKSRRASRRFTLRTRVICIQSKPIRVI